MRKGKYTIVLLVILGILLVIRLAGFLKQDEFISSQNDHASLDRNAKIILTKHAKCRMACRDITLQEIKDIVKVGNINDQKSDIKTGDPKYAIEGYSPDKQHIRVIIVPDDKGLVVVSCMDLDREWRCDCD